MNGTHVSQDSRFHALSPQERDSRLTLVRGGRIQFLKQIIEAGSCEGFLKSSSDWGYLFLHLRSEFLIGLRLGRVSQIKRQLKRTSHKAIIDSFQILLQLELSLARDPRTSQPILITVRRSDGYLIGEVSRVKCLKFSQVSD